MSAPDHQNLERRPLATRELAASKAAARWLARLGATPNAISIGGMASGIAAGIVLALTAKFPEHARLFWLAGALCVQLRLLANMFDGMVAIETGATSSVGEMYNEVPDRISDAATLVGLGYALGANVELGYVAACMALFVAYVRAMGKAAGAQQEFCGPMAKPQRMFFVTVTAIWCAVTPLDWQSCGSFGLPEIVLILIIAGGAITAVRRLLRIAAALRNKSA